MSGGEFKKGIQALEKIGKVLGAFYASQLGEMDQGIKAEHLSRCGFSNVEIADLLGMKANAVNVALHRVRKSKSRPNKK
jgi:hypothetical protein